MSGYVALLKFGLTGDPSAFAAGFTFARAGAAALSLGLTGALVTAVVFLAYQGVAVNRHAGLPVPLWH